jgi:hypothetical protein
MPQIHRVCVDGYRKVPLDQCEERLCRVIRRAVVYNDKMMFQIRKCFANFLEKLTNCPLFIKGWHRNHSVMRSFHLAILMTFLDKSLLSLDNSWRIYGPERLWRPSLAMPIEES